MDALGGMDGMGVPGMMDTNMGGDPMMGDPNAMGGDPNMEGDPNAMGNDQNGFDAGVDADPETDPKKYLQQLAGKLSQELSKYTNENGPDADLSKYIMGMIDAQAAKSLTDSDKSEVIKRIKKGDVNDEDDGSSEGLNNESIITKKLLETTQLSEIINNILTPDDYEKNRNEREVRNPYVNKKKNPFVANR